MWGATISINNLRFIRVISIHAPRVRCDEYPIRELCLFFDFNPRTSCEVRRIITLGAGETAVFQSTHLVWGATDKVTRLVRIWKYFNPRTSCEVRLDTLTVTVYADKFQSTHLVWGATVNIWFDYPIHLISIHAPRVRCDGKSRLRGIYRFISIHAPRVRCD